MDIVKDLRGFEMDHLPDGWPAVKMRQISALCDETERLRDMLRPEWDTVGEALTLAAAAEDADEWMALIERLHNNGRGPWKFSEPDSLEKLRGCRQALRRFLTPNLEVRGTCAASCASSPAPQGCAANGTNDERTDK